MAKHYDIHHIGKDRWKGNITLHLSAGPGGGYRSVSLKTGTVMENVPEDQISEQVRFLTKPKRGRPPVIKLVEVDYEARQAAKDRELEVKKARGLKKMERRKEEVESSEKAEKEAPPKEKKSRKSKDEKELTAEEQAALERGEDLPSS